MGKFYVPGASNLISHPTACCQKGLDKRQYKFTKLMQITIDRYSLLNHPMKTTEDNGCYYSWSAVTPGTIRVSFLV